ncbi:hypothetical protein [Azospirillum brasilense]|uniref:hypothetical protein n=1 Tax=Azospirillum brasilense TaxID=192 RepID=UPI0013B40989|nr:hypothetical protein [Azospirillum brasilense]
MLNSALSCLRPLRSDGRASTVLYLDQNKWIDLARAATAPADNPEIRDILELLCSKVAAGEIILPLTSSNIFETHKVNRHNQRLHLAYTQAALSESKVFRGYRQRLKTEVGRVLSELYGLARSEPDPFWFLSDIFLEATTEADDPRLGMGEFPKALSWIKAHPKEALFNYLMETPEFVRMEAIRRFTEGCEDLRVRIEDRRARHRSENISMRRRLYSAIMAIDQQDEILSIARSLGLPWTCLGDKGGATLRAVIRDTPTFYIEREITLKLEAQERAVTLNDMRDMRTFCTVLPYADIVVAEQQFTSLARQARLHTRYGVHLETDIRALRKLL